MLQVLPAYVTGPSEGEGELLGCFLKTISVLYCFPPPKVDPHHALDIKRGITPQANLCNTMAYRTPEQQ